MVLGCSASRISKIVKLPSLFGAFSILRTQKHTRNNCRNGEISRRRYWKRICLYKTDCWKLIYDKATTIHFDDFSWFSVHFSLGSVQKMSPKSWENRDIALNVWRFFYSSNPKHTRNNYRNEEISRRRYWKRICLYETDCWKLIYDKATTIQFDDFHDFLSILA